MVSRRIKRLTVGLIFLIIVSGVCIPKDLKVADAAEKTKTDIFVNDLVGTLGKGLYQRDPVAIKVCVALLYCDDARIIGNVASLVQEANGPVRKEVLRLALKSSGRAHFVDSKASGQCLAGLLGIALYDKDSVAYVRILVEHMDVQSAGTRGSGRWKLQKIRIALQDNLGETMQIPNLPTDNRLKMDRAVKLKKEWKRWLDELDNNKAQKKAIAKAVDGLFAENPRL